MDVANAMLLHKFSRLCMTTWIRSWASRGGKTKLAAHYTCTVHTVKVHITLRENVYLQNGKTLALPSGKMTLVVKWKRRMCVAVRWVGLTHCWSINLHGHRDAATYLFQDFALPLFFLSHLLKNNTPLFFPFSQFS